MWARAGALFSGVYGGGGGCGDMFSVQPPCFCVAASLGSGMRTWCCYGCLKMSAQSQMFAVRVLPTLHMSPCDLKYCGSVGAIVGVWLRCRTELRETVEPPALARAIAVERCTVQAPL